MNIIKLCESSERFSRICNNSYSWYFWSRLAERDFNLPKDKFIINNPNVKPYNRYMYIVPLARPAKPVKI